MTSITPVTSKGRACEPHGDRPAVVVWQSSTGRVLLCEECLHLWWDHAKTFPSALPLDLLPLVSWASCRCGHPHEAHLHLRAGTDCSMCCDCERFTRTTAGVVADVRSWLRRWVR